MSRKDISQKILKVLFARPMNQCVFPRRVATNVDFKYDKVCSEARLLRCYPQVYQG